MTGDKSMVRAIKIGATVLVLLFVVKGAMDFCRATGC